MKTIYLDNNSTTQLDPEVLEAMLPWLQTPCNASSPHTAGLVAKEAVEQAREQIARLLGATPREITFTSGATEANNLALLGLFQGPQTGVHVITSQGEHSAILDPCKELERRGVRITRLPLELSGTVSLDQLEQAITPETRVVTLMHANNETGALLPLQEVEEHCKSRDVLFHTDATQSVGKVPINLAEIPVDLLSLSAHKFHGPLGVGALFVRRRSPRIRLGSLVFGGGHEQGLRSGTLNVPGIVGLGKAAELARGRMEQERVQLQQLRDQLEAALLAKITGAEVNGSRDARLPNTLNIYIPNVLGSALVSHVEGVCFSSGAACSSANPEPSHVLRSMFQHLGQDGAEDRARCSIRLAVSRFTELNDIVESVNRICKGVDLLRGVQD